MRVEESWRLRTKDQALSDDDILSFWEMMFSPEQTRWDHEDNAAYAQKPAAEILSLFRTILDEGLRTGAIRKNGALRDIRLFGLLL
jgi:hypothetical protein